MFSLLNQFEQPVTVTIQLLKQLHVNVTNTTVNETILNHPDYPSILSISDALNSWHVENVAIKIEPDKLAELPSPCIAFTKSSGGAFILITGIKNDEVFYIDENNRIKTQKLNEFQQQFGGIVLLAQANENSGEADFKKAKQKERIALLKVPAFISVGMLVIAATIINTSPPAGRAGIINTSIINNVFVMAFSVLLLLKFAGVLTTTLLLWYEADKANPALQKICSGGGKTNCNAILNSNASKIFGLSWSEIGFFYFAGGFLFLLMPSSVISQLTTISFLNLIALPYTIFSIYYQWRIAKQWCPLCLTVQAILLLEFITSISFDNLFTIKSFQLINQSTLSTFLIAFTLPAITWIIIKPLLHNQQKAKEDFRSLQRIKFNAEIVSALLQKQKQLTEPPNGLGITLGNGNAANTLIKVCNPYCAPCARAHPEIEKLLEENENLKVQIIFRATKDENDIGALPAKHLLAIAESNNEPKTKQALDDWYLAEKKDYKIFAEKYKLNGELKMQDKNIDMMKNWYDKAEIQFTPTIFFNGYQLPDAYSIGDLKYFLAE